MNANKRGFGRLAFVVALALAPLAMSAGPARADDDHRHVDHRRDDHRDHGRDYHDRGYYDHGGYYAAPPPPVYYAPPEPRPSAGINLFFPIR